MKRNKCKLEAVFTIYRLLNNMILNCMGPLICGFFFSVVNTTILHDLQQTDFADTEHRMQRKLGYKELHIWRANYKFYLDF